MATFKKFNSLLTSTVTTEAGISPAQNNTDVLSPQFRLYIEGVEVPFRVINIGSSYNNRPTADIEVPPQSGLLDIIRGYEPKVHIFFKDENYGGFRLLFWGHIKSSSYALDRASGSSYITFHCEHKNAVMDQIRLDYSGWAGAQGNNLIDNNIESSIVKPYAANSLASIVNAMSGISGVAGEAEQLIPENSNAANTPTDKLNTDIGSMYDRLSGIPGILVNLWNQLKKTAYVAKDQNVAMTKMYIPLVEEGLSFFKRMSGHPYLEDLLQNSKQPWCHTNSTNETNVLIPPAYRTSLISAVQTEAAVRSMQSMMQYSGEMTTITEQFSMFLDNSQYEMQTLTSPAEVEVDVNKFNDDLNTNGGTKISVETIIKPRMPFYFAPTCNVILPMMYSSINVTQDEASTPTRLLAVHDAQASSGGSNGAILSMKGPASVREAQAYNKAKSSGGSYDSLSLTDTLGYTFPCPGKYEQGVGIRPSRIVFPQWLHLLVNNKMASGRGSNQEELPAKGTDDYTQMMDMVADWNARYAFDNVQDGDIIRKVPNPAKKNLNPFDSLNKTTYPHERLLFNTLDYEHAYRVAGARSASISGVFNPYIVVGYPMDVLMDNPNHPSFHGLCTSVNHTITSSSCSTSISMAAAMTYAEMSNFYTPPAPAFLSMALKMTNITRNAGPTDTDYGNDDNLQVKSSTLIQNPVAKAVADQFYREVLGVGAAAPDDLIHFASGKVYPLTRANGVLLPKVSGDVASAPGFKKPGLIGGRQMDDFYSLAGNMRLVRRPIESKDSIEQKFQYKFIDRTRNLYNNNFLNYLNPILAANFYLEPGASLFLDYLEIKDFLE